VSTAVVSDTAIDCVVPDGIGTGHDVAVTIGSVSTVAGSKFAYAPPEVHAVSLPSGYAPATGKGWNAAGGQTLSVLGLNFGSTRWNSGTSAAVSVGGSDISVSVGGLTCISIVRKSDRELECSSPAGVGALGHVSVTVGGQSSSTEAGGSVDSRQHLKSVDSSAD